MRALKIGLLALAGVSAVLSGCQGHGTYTGAFKEEAEARMAQIKAGTEWDMAFQQFRSGDLDKALDSVEQSIALNPSVYKSHLLRGRVLNEMGRLESALGSFDRAIEINPDNPEGYYFRGYVLERFSRPAEAHKSYTKALERDPSNPQYLLAAAETLMDVGRMEDARALLERGRGQFEHNAGVRQTLGHLARMRGEDREAVRLFNEAHLLAPDDPGLLEDLARALYDVGEYNEAEYKLARLLEMDLETPRRDLRHMRAQCLLELDRPVEARSIYRGLTEGDRGASDIRAWIGLGKAALILEESRELRRAAQRVIASAPRRYEGRMLLGAALRLEGAHQQAARELDRAVRMSETDPLPVVLLALTLQDLGREDRARALFQLAASRMPADEEMNRSLRVLADVPVRP